MRESWGVSLSAGAATGGPGTKGGWKMVLEGEREHSYITGTGLQRAGDTEQQ